MPIKKHDNKKNAPVKKRNSAKVPKKEESSKWARFWNTAKIKVSNLKVNALAVVGKKKKP